MLAIITGNGKGKTTSCLGHMIRAVGQGKRAIMFQFIKGDWVSGEYLFTKEMKLLKGRFEIHRGGKGFVGILGDQKPFSEHKEAARETFAEAKKAVLSKKWDMIVLDELNVALDLKLLPVRGITAFLKKIPTKKIVIVSGRNAPAALVQIADLVSEIREIKHPYQKGILAQKSFDY